MFADSALGARIDRSEAGMCARLAASLPTQHILPISGGLAIYGGPSAPMNKVIGLGFDQPLDIDGLAVIEAEWRAREEPVRIELSILTEPAIAQALGERGYRLHGFENVLGHPLKPQEDAATASGVTVEILRESDAAAWARIAMDAFSNLDGTGSVADDANTFSQEQLEAAFKEYREAPGFTSYLARFDGEPVGEAAMRIDAGLAQFAGSGTLPAYRGRGVQKALVQRRLSDARTAGCDLAVVVTAPGSRSQENVMRRGFALLYTRAILIRDWR